MIWLEPMRQQLTATFSIAALRHQLSRQRALYPHAAGLIENARTQLLNLARCHDPDQRRGLRAAIEATCRRLETVSRAGRRQ